ncbi:MAG TPA: hypothetical protein VFI84_00015 [Candidatus Saccharimonadales bacterium]|nr:hypothetical protein [Candidatus Saccharimonadales bacterium]
MREMEPVQRYTTVEMVTEYVSWLGICSIEHVLFAMEEEERHGAQTIGIILWKLREGSFTMLPGGRIKSTTPAYKQDETIELPAQIDLTDEVILSSANLLPARQSS